jgi:hypothetical protein
MSAVKISIYLYSRYSIYYGQEQRTVYRKRITRQGRRAIEPAIDLAGRSESISYA